MEDSTKLREIDSTQCLEGISKGLADMEDHGDIKLNRPVELALKGFDLLPLIGRIPIVIQPDLADSYMRTLRELPLHIVKLGGVVLLDIGWVQANGGEKSLGMCRAKLKDARIARCVDIG